MRITELSKKKKKKNLDLSAQTACSCFALWTMCVHSVFTATVWIGLSQWGNSPAKWFRVTQYCGLWRSSTLLLVCVSNNDELSAVGLTTGRHVWVSVTLVSCVGVVFTHHTIVFFPPQTHSACWEMICHSIVKKAQPVFWACKDYI